MKNAMWQYGVMFGVLLCASLTYAGDWEFRGAYEAGFPGGDLWDSASGGELKAIYWYDTQLGIAVSTGVSKWDVKDQRDVRVPARIWDDWSGDAKFTPLGVSVIKQKEFVKNANCFTLSAELGVSYLFSSSNIDVGRTQIVPEGIGGAWQAEFVSDSADIDDSIVGRLGATIGWQALDQLKVFLSGGYQFDISSGDLTVDSLRISEELDMDAFFVQIGVVIRK